MDRLIDEVFGLTSDVRYVAVLLGRELRSRQRAELANASSSESDLYEEWLVNPTLLTLAGRRGEIDCGGLDYLVVRYGNFAQLVMPLTGVDGHVSIGFEPWANPMEHAEVIAQIAQRTLLSQRDEVTR
jgi:hypothetical protein